MLYIIHTIETLYGNCYEHRPLALPPLAASVCLVFVKAFVEVFVNLLIQVLAEVSVKKYIIYNRT